MTKTQLKTALLSAAKKAQAKPAAKPATKPAAKADPLAIPKFLDAKNPARAAQIKAAASRPAQSVRAIDASKVAAPKPKAKAEPKSNERHDTALRLFKRANGASRDEIVEACKWPAVFAGKLADTLAKRHGLKVRRIDGEAGLRYALA